MRIDEYQKLAMRTSPDNHDKVENGCLGLIGESGEVVDIVKKWKYQSGGYAALPSDDLLDECGDVLWYCAELAEGLGASLKRICERYDRVYFPEMNMVNAALPLERMAMRLAKLAVAPYSVMYDSSTEIPFGWKIEQTTIDIAGVVITVEDILRMYCSATLEDAMERNIDKLRKRYPDGFDPERSLHRA